MVTRRDSAFFAVAGIGAGTTGAALGIGRMPVAFAIPGSIAAIHLLRASPATLLSLSLLIVWLGRLVIVTLELPDAVLLGAYSMVGLAFAKSLIAGTALQRWTILGVTGVGLSLLTTTVLTGSSGIFAAGYFSFLMLYPITTSLARSLNERSRQLLLFQLIIIGILQAILVLPRIATVSHPDHLRGTLFENEAGAHLVGGLGAALALYELSRAIDGPRYAWRWRLLRAALWLSLTWVTESQQVIGGFVVACLAGFVLASPHVRSLFARRVRWSLAGTIVVIGVALQYVRQGIVDRVIAAVDPSSFGPVVAWRRLATEADLAGILFGAGAGSGASRLSLIIETNNVSFAGIERPGTPAFHELALETSNPFGGTLERVASSWSGTITDGGAFLLITTLVAITVVTLSGWRRASPGGRFLRASMLTMLVGLSSVSHWLEFPEFALSVGVLLGVGTSSSQVERRQPIRPSLDRTLHSG